DIVGVGGIVGYHREEAGRYRAELGDPVDARMSGAARGRLLGAAHRALLRQDEHAAINLFWRAEAVSGTPLGLVDELSLVDAIFFSGDLRGAYELAAERAAAHDGIARRCLLIQQGVCRLYLEPEGAAEVLGVL